MQVAMRVRLVLALAFMSAVSAAHAQNRNLKAAAATATATALEPVPAVVDTSKPPPPTIADLVLLLQSYKPDPERIDRIRVEMEAVVPAGAEPGLLAAAWHQKALAAGELQELDRRNEFLAKSIEYARLATGGTPVVWAVISV